VPGAAPGNNESASIDNAEIIATVHARKTPMSPASTGLRI
jgi:hypothetical protein